jgi:DNA-binding SARP family transcriptional activator
VLSVAVLGPLWVDGPDGPVGVGDRKTREVLALLALAAPRPLSVSALATTLWDEPPRSAVKTVQAHVSRARTALNGAIGGGATGYHLLLDRVELDVAAVGELRRRARIAALAGDDHGAAQLLSGARARWRGEPELPPTSAGEAERARWVEEQLLLVEDQLAAVIAAGDGRTVLGELESLTAEHPLRERLWALRMEALYRSGRQADALAAYRSVRRLLRDELGVEPGPALRALEAGVLAQALPARQPGGSAGAGTRCRSWGRATPSRPERTSRTRCSERAPSTCCCSTRHSCPSTPTARSRTSARPWRGWRAGGG